MLQLSSQITNHIVANKKECTAFFLFELVYLILVAYDNHWDCYFKKALCSRTVCPKETRKVLYKEEEPEGVVVQEEEEEVPGVVAMKKHFAQKRNAFVKLCQEAPGGLDENLYQVLLQQIKGSETEALERYKLKL